MRSLVIALILIASVAAPARGQERDGAAIAQIAPVRIDATRDSIGRMTAPVFLNGRGPYAFVVDTGANRSAISRRVADALGLETDGTGEVHAFTGVFEAPMARVAHFRSGAMTVSDVRLPVIDGPMLANADGLLGVEALRERRLILDVENSTVSLDDGRRPLAGRGWVMVPGRVRFGNLIVATGRIGRINAHVIIDTGAQTSVVNTALRNALASGRGDARPVTGTRIRSVAGPVVLDEAVFIPRLYLSDAGIANLTAYAGDLYIFELWGLTDEPAIIVGMDVVRHMRALALNYRDQRIELRVTRQSPPPVARLVH